MKVHGKLDMCPKLGGGGSMKPWCVQMRAECTEIPLSFSCKAQFQVHGKLERGDYISRLSGGAVVGKVCLLLNPEP